LKILGEIHDIGKVTINENILNKKDGLNEDEWVDVKKHSEIEYHIALATPELTILNNNITNKDGHKR
jgi:HD-GYP domain-containing protein (c-di-GMP phosphodiesterase class II)